MAKHPTPEQREDAALHREAVKKETSTLPPKVVKISEELSCDLNEVEWTNKARELAEAHREVARQEERKKTVAAGLANDVKIAKAKESKLADIVSSRQEQREITVEVKYDYDLGTVTRTRTDTDEVIGSREMTDEERQLELDMLAPNKDPDVGKTSDSNKSGSDFDPDEEATGDVQSEDDDLTDEDLEDDDPIEKIKNLDHMNDGELESTANDLGVDITSDIVEGDDEATRENIKTSIREEISQRADVEEESL
jgi:hypothetical protein